MLHTVMHMKKQLTGKCNAPVEVLLTVLIDDPLQKKTPVGNRHIA